MAVFVPFITPRLSYILQVSFQLKGRHSFFLTHSVLLYPVLYSCVPAVPARQVPLRTLSQHELQIGVDVRLTVRHVVTKEKMPSLRCATLYIGLRGQISCCRRSSPDRFGALHIIAFAFVVTQEIALEDLCLRAVASDASVL